MEILNWLPWYYLPMMIAGFALPLFLVFKLLRGSAERSRILSKGVPAQAQIMRVWETGVRVNHQPQIGFHLQVHPQHAAPYVAESKMICSALMFPQLQPGAYIPVKFDPADPSKVAINL